MALGGLLAAGACLPDLSALPPPNGESEAAPPPFVGCGDGIIATLSDGGDSGESCDPGADGSATGCSRCQIACEGYRDPESDHCYFPRGNAGTFGEAVSACSLQRAHLVTIGSAAELESVRRAASDDGGYWIGLSRENRLRGAYASTRTEEPGFPYPGAGDPSAIGPCDGCFGVGADAGLFPVMEGGTSAAAECIASQGGRWLQVSCNLGPRPVVCEREPLGSRAVAEPQGFSLVLPKTGGAKTYLVVVSSADPATAALACGFIKGGSLVVLDSREEREQLAHELINRKPSELQELWIGLSTTDAGAWVWEDGLPADGVAGARPLPWGNAQPPTGAIGRAFMRVSTLTYDTQLAFADDGGAPRLFICQLPVR